ncbi:MAG: hypothetical protein ACI935_002018 [Moritella dasanensis]|jgi:uncharacterized protein YifN (PemK superfamily)
MKISIKYFNFEGSMLLGVESYDDYDEVLIPDFNEDKHDVYVRKVFTPEPNTELWKIESLDIDNLDVEIYVSPQDGSTSLGQTAKAQQRAASHYFKVNEFQLVEVEFGIQQDIMTPNGRQGKNTSYSNALLQGELYKKRPCIVHSCHGDRVKVIPLTSDGDRKDAKQLQIHQKAFQGLNYHYKRKDSFALVDTIQTVSTYRIHPMRLQDGTFSNKFDYYRLTDDDAKELKNKLTKIYAKDTLDENVRLSSNNDVLTKEIKSLRRRRSTLNLELSEKAQYASELEQSLKKLAEAVGLENQDIKGLIEYINEL